MDLASAWHSANATCAFLKAQMVATFGLSLGQFFKFAARLSDETAIRRFNRWLPS